MDKSLIPHDFTYASPTQRTFLKNASIESVCSAYDRQRLYTSNAHVKRTNESTYKLLKHLESLGHVYEVIDQTNSMSRFLVLDKKVDDTTLKKKKKSNDDFNLLHIKVQSEVGEFEAIDKTNDLNYRLWVATKYTDLIRSAVKRGLENNLDIKDVEMLLNQKRCFYTGVLFDKDNPLTVDRVRRAQGYVKGNVIACTNQANQLKNKLIEHPEALFTDINTLKRFVDIIFTGMSSSKDPLEDLLLFK